MVVFFRNGILGGKPQILLCADGIAKTCPCKALYGFVCVVHTLQHTRAVKMVNQLSGFFSVGGSKYKLCLSALLHPYFRVFIYVAICMTRQCDRLFPVLYTGLDSLHHNRRSENRTVQNGANGSVGTFPHFFQIIFCHSRSIGCNRRTFYSNTIF